MEVKAYAQWNRLEKQATLQIVYYAIAISIVLDALGKYKIRKAQAEAIKKANHKD